MVVVILLAILAVLYIAQATWYRLKRDEARMVQAALFRCLLDIAYKDDITTFRNEV